MENQTIGKVKDDKIFRKNVKLFIGRIRMELDALEVLMSSEENGYCSTGNINIPKEIVTSNEQQQSKPSSVVLTPPFVGERIQDVKRYSEFPVKGTPLPTKLTKRPILPEEGLNEFGFFSYDSKKRTLLTPVTSAHHKYMVDSGIIALECEMVGVGVGPGKKYALARISIVNEFGFCMYDKIVKPVEEVTDFKTCVRSIREEDLRNAVPFPVVQKQISKILDNHIIIGNRLDFDLAIMKLSHPKSMKRDTSYFRQAKIGFEQPHGLQQFIMRMFRVDNQGKGHVYCSITDAQVAMALYQRYRIRWEKWVREKFGVQDPLQDFRRTCTTPVETVPETQSTSYCKLFAVVDKNMKMNIDFPVKGAPLPKKGRQELPLGDRNAFKFFKYTELGNLQTRITPLHYNFMLDSGIIAIHTELEAMQVYLHSKTVSVSLIRVILVNEYGFCMYDKYTHTQETYLADTFMMIESSGSWIKEVVPHSVVQEEVSEILRNHILVGHHLDKSCFLLNHFHPHEQIRDTATYFKQKFGYTETPSLQTLAKRLYCMPILAEDKFNAISAAQTAMACYLSYRNAWEKSVRLDHGNVFHETLEKFTTSILSASSIMF